MRSKTESTLILAVAALAAAALVATAEDAAIEGQALHELEVIDESEFRLEVEKTELEFTPRPEEMDEGETNVEELLFTWTPVERFNPLLYDSEKVDCPLVPDFASRPVTKAPVAVFRTGFSGDADIKEWELSITDYRGEIFHSLQGNGIPPAELAWNGEGVRDELLKPGFPYSFLFTIVDSGTNSYRYAGNTLSLPCISYQNGKDLRIEASGFSLFEEGSTQPRADGGLDMDRIVREILDSPKRAVQVEAWAANETLAAERAAWLARTIERMLLLSEGQIGHEGKRFKGDPPARRTAQGYLAQELMGRQLAGL